jgi:hypothetical protein
MARLLHHRIVQLELSCLAHEPAGKKFTRSTMRAFHFHVFGIVALLAATAANAQTPQMHPALAMASFSVSAATPRTVKIASLPAKPAPRRLKESRQQYSIGALAAGYAAEPSFENRFSIEAVRTPFLSESTYPVMHLWRGLDLDGFDNTIHAQNTELGWLASSGYFQAAPPSNHDQASVGTSSETYGISLRYTFGSSKEHRLTPVWRSMSSWVTGAGS